MTQRLVVDGSASAHHLVLFAPSVGFASISGLESRYTFQMIPAADRIAFIVSNDHRHLRWQALQKFHFEMHSILMVLPFAADLYDRQMDRAE